MLAVLASAAAFVTLAICASHFWVVGAAISFLAYSIWTFSFKCPVCGTPYLYTNGGKGDPYGLVFIPTSFPIKCRKCGHDSGATES